MTVNTIKLEKTLEDFGLSSREARVYLYLLRTPEQKAYTIARNLGLPRATVYLTLETLRKQGIVSVFKKNNIAYYDAEHPQRLAKIAEYKDELIQSILPDLSSLLQDKGNHPTIKLYTGKESLKTIFKGLYDIMDAQGVKQLYTISHPELQHLFPKYLSKVIELKRKRKIHTHLMVPEESRNSLPSEYFPDAFREMRFLPKEFPFRGTIMIAADTIAFFSIKDEMIFAITIESTIMANILKQLFLFTWNGIKS